jgi:flagellar motor switch protein FliG
MPEATDQVVEQEPQMAETPTDAPDADKSGLQLAIPGPRKAAIALMMLGNDIAGKVLGELDDDEIEKILTTASKLKNVGSKEAEQVLAEFNELIIGRALLLPRADEFVRSVAEDTLGDKRVRAMLGITAQTDTEDALQEAISAGAGSIATVLKKEQPQIAAIALAVMDPLKAAEVLTLLPEESQAEVVRRIAEIRTVTPELLRVVGETLKDQVKTSHGLTIDGEHLVVNMLKQLSPEDEDIIFEHLSEDHPELAEDIRKKMFIFEDLMAIAGRAVQILLKEVDGRTLTTSLKTASDELRDHILSNMSSRAATMILEDLEALGPVSVNQVEQAQDEVVQAALRLAAEGKITLR